MKRVSALGPELAPEQSERLADAVKKVDILVNQARAVTRTTLTFIQRHSDGEASPPPLCRCNAEVRKWLQVVPTLIPDDVIEVQTRYHLAEDEPFLADLNGVLYVLRNLWTNAKNAFKDVSRLSYRVIFSVSIEELEEAKSSATGATYIVLRVADNGNGIPPEIRDRIFRNRIDGGSGHGLGSQIIRWVMDSHRGLIRFATAEGVGTMIELCFRHFSLITTAVSRDLTWL